MKKHPISSHVAALAACIMLWCAPAWSQVPGNAVSSSKHYRESGVGNATGRAGAASMTARALLGKDGNATVEVTTGTLDSSGTPPGALAKVQFKPLTQLGTALLSQNFTPTGGGYYEFTWPSLYRAEQIQLQGNITGIDKNRTDVVTLVETVKLRPDLAVQSLTFPPTRAVNQAVNISANIVEMNGDIAATTTCVLAIDGTNVDQAKNVYVDAGGSVSCAFTYTFTTTGSHTIQVTAANVVPADWDTSNNSASGTISIVTPDNLPHGNASFQSINGGFPIVATQTTQITYNGTLIQNTSDSYGQSGVEQGSFAEFYGYGCGNQFPAFKFPVNVTNTETMDGTTVYSFVDAGMTGYSYSSGGFGFPLCTSTAVSETVQQGYDYASDHTQYVTSVQYFDGGGNAIWTEQVLESWRNAGDVTYVSYGYDCLYFGNCNSPGDYYFWNSSSNNTYGTIIPVGSTWASSLSVQDSAGNTASGNISVPLNTQTYNQYLPNTCYTQGPSGGYTYTFCRALNYNYNYTFGSASK